MMEIPTLEDDGLLTLDIGPWGIEKYRHVALYSSVFIKSMRKIWECLVYIDLFSGAGRSKIKGANRIIPGSPMIALSLDQKFDKYIFCERDKATFNALAERIKRNYREYDISIVNGDANSEVDKLLQLIPQPAKNFRVLTFCFVDPYSLDNLKFATIRRLSTRYIDFLVLIPSGMDAARNVDKYYRAPESTKLDAFLGRKDWRESLKIAEQKGIKKEGFIIQEFSQSMRELGFKDPGLESPVPIYFDEKKLLLYRLVLYSRRELGNRFWREIKKSLDPQRRLKFLVS
ncbi:MAG: three-Cys-motif partner protein TcmP [Candidatus Aminicenantales bacterium]